MTQLQGIGKALREIRDELASLHDDFDAHDLMDLFTRNLIPITGLFIIASFVLGLAIAGVRAALKTVHAPTEQVEPDQPRRHPWSPPLTE